MSSPRSRAISSVEKETLSWVNRGVNGGGWVLLLTIAESDTLIDPAAKELTNHGKRDNHEPVLG